MMHFVESHPDSFAPFLREMGNEYERHEIFFFASNCMFNVKHLALADLISLLILILQIGGLSYFSSTSGMSSWRAKLYLYVGKIPSSKCCINVSS